MAISAEWYTKDVTLDYADGHVPDLYAHEGDANGRGIDLAIVDGGKPASTTGMTVYLAWGHEKGGEGLTQFSAVDASKGRWRVLYPTSMQRRGTVLARVLVYLNGSRSAMTGSKNFRIFVDVDPVDGVTAMADNDFSVFQQAVIDLNTARANAEASTRAANAAATNATASAGKADAAAARANAAASSAANAASAAQSAAGAANSSASAADAAAAGANEAAGKATSATTNANSATKSATNAASQAQGAASSATAAASTALQIANSIAGRSAGEGEVAGMRRNIDTLGNQVAELSGTYLVMDETLYTPRAKVAASGETVTMVSATVSGEIVSLT